ncbi:MAG TPA: Dyp-type peroxidase [Solirubrobacteraceae bacterium]|nr:Dyp-type peroxidase [Solirubrobacteraceae bacterium]
MPRSSDQPGPPSHNRGGGPKAFKLTRRDALAGAALLGAGAAADHLLDRPKPSPAEPARAGEAVAFHGPHQAGIATPQQSHLYFAAYDLKTTSPPALRELLREWSAAAAALTVGREYAGDPGEALGLAPARLTLTFGLGPGLFASPALRRMRPPQLRELPAFPGELIDPQSSGGDLCVQACADDPQVAFHALHVLGAIAGSHVVQRWSHTGFVSTPSAGTPRNLIGFKDGTNNLRGTDDQALDRFVWVQSGDGPSWLTGGSYMIVRRIEIVFPTWDTAGLAAQEQAIGRRKASGAPLGSLGEHDPVDLSAVDAIGAPVIPAHAHIRLAAAETNGGKRILRRGYHYSQGFTQGAVDRGGHLLDGGLFFLAFVRDPRQFITIQRRLATSDALSAFTVHTASAIFVCPPGAARGGYVGEGLFS